ncbi:MAG: hypothetical protein RLY29_662 [Actinomycetota bacterium]|jgi:hypothetical protein
MGSPPFLTGADRSAALLKATEYRRRRSEFKFNVKCGKVSWIVALDSSDEAIKRMRLRELVAALPGFGDIRAIAVLERAGISPNRRVQGLGKSQRVRLEEILKGRM